MIIDAHGWSYKNNFMWCTLLHSYNCTFLRIFSHFCAHVHLHSRGRGWHSDTSWSFFKIQELQIFFYKSTPSLDRVECKKTPILLIVFETRKVANFLLKITTPLARVECAKTRRKVLSLGKQ